MKKRPLTLFAAAAVFAATALTACLNTPDNEMHMTTFYPLEAGGKVLYADQLSDTTTVASYDSWDASVSFTNGGDWLSISPKSAEVAAGYCLYQTMRLTSTENTTGYARQAAIYVTPHTDAISTIAMGVTQYAWLNITVPQPTYTTSSLTTAEATFSSALTADATEASLAFTVYQDSATVESDAEWLSIPSDIRALAAGGHGLSLTVQPNTSAAERTAHVTLRSGNISNVITYTQAAKN